MAMYLTGADIAAIRKALGLTLTAFGELLGVKAPTIYRWETEDRRPRHDDMMRLNELRVKHKVRVPSESVRQLATA